MEDFINPEKEFEEELKRDAREVMENPDLYVKSLKDNEEENEISILKLSEISDTLIEATNIRKVLSSAVGYKALKESIEKDGQQYPIIIRKLKEKEKQAEKDKIKDSIQKKEKEKAELRKNQTKTKEKLEKQIKELENNLSIIEGYQYGIIDGHTRYKAIKAANKEDIKVKIIDSVEDEKILSFKLNFARKDMNRSEKGKILAELKNDKKIKSNEKLADLFGISESYVAKLIKEHENSGATINKYGDYSLQKEQFINDFNALKGEDIKKLIDDKNWEEVNKLRKKIIDMKMVISYYQNKIDGNQAVKNQIKTDATKKKEEDKIIKRERGQINNNKYFVAINNGTN